MNKSDEWRAASIVDTDGTERWYVVDDTEEPQPVAVCPRGKESAEEICFNRQMLDPIWGAADESKHGELEKKSERYEKALKTIVEFKGVDAMQIASEALELK